MSPNQNYLITHPYLDDIKVGSYENWISNDIDKYYSIEDYNNIRFGPNAFSLISFNIRSFHANGNIFESFLDSLDIETNFILLCETWNNDINVSLCEIQGSKSHHVFRNGSRGGGVSIFGSNKFNSVPVSHLS